jgi:hypothetical protein
VADSRYAENPKTAKIAQCYWCAHFQGGEKCRAFRKKPIPDAILNNFHDHNTAYPGDNGIRFEPIKDKRKK